MCTCVTAEPRGSAAPSLGSAGAPSRLAGGQPVALLRTRSVAVLRGALQDAAEPRAAADVGAEAATRVPGSAGRALGGGS